MMSTLQAAPVFPAVPVLYPGNVADAQARSSHTGWDNVDKDGIDFDPEKTDSKTSQTNKLMAAGMVETDEGKQIRCPGGDVFSGQAPFAAPMMGFHGKVNAIFDAFAYLPCGQACSERPANFLPIVGLVGDDKLKNTDPSWKLFGRLRQDVYARVKQELGDINAGAVKPVVLVTRMRADNVALFSISQPHQMLAPSLWLAALPVSVMTVPMATLNESKVLAIILAERAKAVVSAAEKASYQQGEQFSLAFL